MYFIDTHAHSYLKQFAQDRAQMMARTLEAQVKRVYLPNIDHTSIEAMMELEAQYPENCFAMMGLHPCAVDKNFQKELYLVEEWLNKRPFVAVGEIGTDLYWDKIHFEEQKEAFRIQVRLAKEHRLPIVIHCRNSFQETIDLLTPLVDESLTGIFHCFGGTVAEAQQVIDLGFKLGIGGVVTYKNAGLDTVLPAIDLAHLVLETDSPYLAPIPYRGKRNETSYIPIIAQKIADIKQIPLTEVGQKTTENALALFEK
jgi:TatD DNase family protein